MMTKSKRATTGRDESSPEDEIVRGNVRRRVERSASFVSVYSNDVQLQTSPWDMRLTFGTMQVNPDAEDGPTAHVLEVAEVRLSPQLAKRVAEILAQQIAAYESRMGTIPQPSED